MDPRSGFAAARFDAVPPPATSNKAPGHDRRTPLRGRRRNQGIPTPNNEDRPLRCRRPRVSRQNYGRRADGLVRPRRPSRGVQPRQFRSRRGSFIREGFGVKKDLRRRRRSLFGRPHSRPEMPKANAQSRRLYNIRGIDGSSTIKNAAKWSARRPRLWPQRQPITILESSMDAGSGTWSRKLPPHAYKVSVT